MAFYQNVPEHHPRKVNHAELGAWEEEGSRYRTGNTGKRSEKSPGKAYRPETGRGQDGRKGREDRNARYGQSGSGREGGYSREGGHSWDGGYGRDDNRGGNRKQGAPRRDRRDFRPERPGPGRRQAPDSARERDGRRREQPDRQREAFDRQRETEESRHYTEFEYVPVQAEEAEEALASQQYILTGRNPIREALKNGRDLEKLLVQKGELSGSARAIVQEAKEQKVMVQVVEKSRLDEIAPQHQGLIAFASAYQYSTLEQMLDTAKERGEAPFLILLDGITDPHNLGAIIRSAECAGAHGVIVPQHRSVGLTPAAVKASAGAVEYMKVARVTNLNRTIEDLQRLGIWVYAVTMDGQDYLDVPFDGAAALVIGAEGEGISRLTAEKCDMKVSLPMSGHLDSLNASVAAGVMMYRVAAARKTGKA